MKTPSSRTSAAGFSLIELLVVCSIIAVVIGFTVPAATTMIRGSQLTQASQTLADQIALARQLALSKNRMVEVRIFRFADPEAPGESATNSSTWHYRALQAYEVLESGAAVPLTKYSRLPNSIIIDEGALSSLISDTTRQAPKKPAADKTAPELPGGVAKNYEYISFRYLQDGSTDLPLTSKSSTATTTNWFMTLHGIELPASLTEPKFNGKGINFFTLQIDPVSGATKSYRPTAS